MDKIQKVLVKAGRKDLAQEYYKRVSGKGPGKPDGTGPMKDDPRCPFKKKKKSHLKRADVVNEFKDKMAEIVEAVRDAFRMLPSGSIRDRADSYWHKHILGAVDKEEYGILGGSMIDMADTLKELDKEDIDEIALKRELKKLNFELRKIDKKDKEILVYVPKDSGVTEDGAGDAIVSILEDLDIDPNWGFEIIQD